MDAKYLAEIRARGQMAKAEKQKGNDLDCACLSWAIVLNDLPALLAEVEQDERSLPSRGVWIEIPEFGTALRVHLRSLPSRGVWIEIA